MSRGEYVSIGQLKGYEIHIIFEDDNPIFKQPNRFSDVKRALVQTRTIQLLEFNLVKMFKGGYASIIMVLVKNTFLYNCTKPHMWRL